MLILIKDDGNKVFCAARTESFAARLYCIRCVRDRVDFMAMWCVNICANGSLCQHTVALKEATCLFSFACMGINTSRIHSG
jgi:hypothetical protein